MIRLIHPFLASPDLSGLDDFFRLLGTFIPIYLLDAFSLEPFSAHRLGLGVLQFIVLLAAEFIQWNLTRRVPMPARVVSSVLTYLAANFGFTFAVESNLISIRDLTGVFLCIHTLCHKA